MTLENEIFLVLNFVFFLQVEMERLEKMFARQLKEAEEKRRLAEEKLESMQRSRGKLANYPEYFLLCI